MNKKSALLIVIFAIVAAGLFYKQSLKTSFERGLTNSVYKQIPKTPNTTNTNPAPGNVEKQTSISTDKKNVLDLSNQGLEQLPSYVLKMSNLEELNISNNQIGGALTVEIIL